MYTSFFFAFIKKKIDNAIQLLRAAALENTSALTLLIFQLHLFLHLIYFTVMCN